MLNVEQQEKFHTFPTFPLPNVKEINRKVEGKKEERETEKQRACVSEREERGEFMKPKVQHTTWRQESILREMKTRPSSFTSMCVLCPTVKVNTLKLLHPRCIAFCFIYTVYTSIFSSIHVHSVLEISNSVLHAPYSIRFLSFRNPPRRYKKHYTFSF